MSDAAQRAVARLLPADRTDLAELVLTTPAAGRGPVDPEVADEPQVRLRAAVSALARICELDDVGESTLLRGRRRFGARDLVVGPGLTDPEWVGRRDQVRIQGGPLDAMALAHWSRRVADGSGMRWRRVWDRMAARDTLEPALDLGALARSWVDRLGVERVEVVLSPATPGPDPVAIDLTRRLNQVLAVRSADVRAGVAWLPWPAPSGDLTLGVPAHRLRWATGRAERLAEEIAGLGCRTVGDPRLVVPSTDPGVRRSVPAAATLDLAVAVLSRLPRQEHAHG